MTTRNETQGSRLLGLSVSRRAVERYPVVFSPFHATWLSDWEKMDETGDLVDISMGGFGARMHKAPENGRLLHVRLSINTASGNGKQPIEMDARVCGRIPLGETFDSSSDWIVNCSIESIHPLDESRMARAIGKLKSEILPAS